MGCTLKGGKMIKKNVLHKFTLSVIVTLAFSFVSLFVNIESARAEDDWIKITSPASGDELCVGTVAMIRVKGISGNFITQKLFEISKRSNPDLSNSADWETIFVEKTTVDQRVIDCECPIEIKKEYANDPNRIIRIRISTRGKNFAFDATVKIFISEKPVLNAVNWIDSEPLGNRKPLVLIHGIGLSFIVPGIDKNVKDLIPEEKQWDNLLLKFKEGNIFNYYKPYIYLYDSNDTDDTIPSEDGVAEVAKFLEKRLIEKNLNSNLYFIAHSMGGLVSRQFMSNNEAKINRIITLFTPHHGSMLPNYPPAQLVMKNKNGSLSNFLKDISWDYDVSGLGELLVNSGEIDQYVRNETKQDSYFGKDLNEFIKELNKPSNSNYKVIPYYGENPNLSLGALFLINSEILSPHWDKILKGLEKWAVSSKIDTSGLKDFKKHDGVVQSRSGMGYGLGFQNPRLIAGCDHIGWSQNDFMLKDFLFGQIVKDINAYLSQTPQPDPPSKLLPAPVAKPETIMDNGDVKLEWSEVKDTGVYHLEIAQYKNSGKTIKSSDYSSPYKIWTIDVPVPYIAVPSPFFIDGVEYVWHVRAGSKTSVLGKYSLDHRFTYSRNGLNFGPPDIVSPGTTDETIEVPSQDENNITLAWRLDTRFAGKVDHFAYEVSTKPYWSKPYITDYVGVRIPSTQRSEMIRLKPGTYYWRICSQDTNDKDNGWSVSNKFTLVYAPKPVCNYPAPMNLRIDQSCSPKKIELFWDKPQDTACNLTGYELNFSFDGKNYPVKLKEGDDNYKLQSAYVVEEKEYCFQLAALYADKKSEANTAKILYTCKQCSKPPERLSSPPVGSLDVQNKSITFTWDEPLMQSSCKTRHYEIYYKKNGIEDSSLGSKTVFEKSIVLNKGLSQGFEYQIGVKGVNDAGPAQGDPVWSNKVKFEFNCTPTTPGKPLAINSSTLCDDGFMSFRWDPSTVTKGCNQLFGYVVEAEYNRTPLKLVNRVSTSNEYKLPLDKSGLYRARVIAGGEAKSQWSDEVKYDCSSVNCSPPPTKLALTPSGNKMIMSWIRPDVLKSCYQVEKYKFRFYIAPDKTNEITRETPDTTVNSWTMQQGKAIYCFQVKAIYFDGKESDWAPSNDKYFTREYNYAGQQQPPADCKPSAPVLNVPLVDCQNKMLKLTWSKSIVQQGCPAIYQYKVYVKTNNGDFYPRIASRECDEIPVQNGEIIEVKIKAIADNSESDFSRLIKIIIDCKAPPQPPNDCKPSKPGIPKGELMNNSDLMKFSWSASTVPAGCKKIKTYIYQYNFGGDPPEDTYDSRGESYAIVKPIFRNAKGIYCFWVKAVTEDGISSEWSEHGCFEYTPPNPPQPPNDCTNPKPPTSIRLSKDCNMKLITVTWLDSVDRTNCKNLKYKYNLYLNNARHSNGNLTTSPATIQINENGTYYLEIASLVGDNVGKYERSESIVFDCEKKTPSKKIELITENGRMYDKNIKPSDFRLSWKGIDDWDDIDKNMKYVLKIINTATPNVVYEWHVSDGNRLVDWNPLANACFSPEGTSFALDYNSTYTWSVSLVDKNHPNPYIESEKRYFYTTSDPNNYLQMPTNAYLEDTFDGNRKISCGEIFKTGNDPVNPGKFSLGAVVINGDKSADEAEIYYQKKDENGNFGDKTWLASGKVIAAQSAMLFFSLPPGSYCLFVREVDNVDNSGNLYPPSKVRVSNFMSVFRDCNIHIQIVAQSLNSEIKENNLIQNPKSANYSNDPCCYSCHTSSDTTPAQSADCNRYLVKNYPIDFALYDYDNGRKGRSR